MINTEINIEKPRNEMKICPKCGQRKAAINFIRTKKWAFPDGKFSICNSCINKHLKEEDYSWQIVDKLCQVLDVPFLPREFERIKEQYPEKPFIQYAEYYSANEYEPFGWDDYFNKYKELKQKAELDKELPLLKDDYYQDLMLRWGQNYDHEQLVYLENLYNGLLATQSVAGALQHDQAQKLCKISLQIDERIRADEDFDKLMATYEKMTKVADFTPKNAKSDSEFSSFGEVAAWLEKRGWINKWYDDANKDIVDEVIHSSQSFVQRLYTNESGIGEEINERIHQLEIAAALDKEDSDLGKKRFEDPFFDIDTVDLEQRDNEVYEEFLIDDILDAETTNV